MVRKLNRIRPPPAPKNAPATHPQPHQRNIRCSFTSCSRTRFLNCTDLTLFLGTEFLGTNFRDSLYRFLLSRESWTLKMTNLGGEGHVVMLSEPGFFFYV